MNMIWNSSDSITSNITTSAYDNTMLDTINAADLATITITDSTLNSGYNIYNTGTYTTDTIVLGNPMPNNHSLSVTGDADIKGNLTVNGKDIGEALEKIEEHLAILKPDPALEDRWQQLRDLRNQYEALKQDIIEKEKLYEILAK